MERKGLLDHVKKKHKSSSGVCPICATQIYGDPNYVSKDLSGHLQMRHQYDLDTYTDYQNEDDAILAAVLA